MGQGYQVQRGAVPVFEGSTNVHVLVHLVSVMCVLSLESYSTRESYTEVLFKLAPRLRQSVQPALSASRVCACISGTCTYLPYWLNWQTVQPGAGPLGL